MNQDKFAKLQMQITQNNAEYQNFLGDLDSWEQDVKVKDQELKEEKPSEQNALPPVRNSLEKKKKKKKKKPKPKPVENESVSTTKKKNKIKGFDYRSWDKFDVDAACEEVDDEASKSSEDEYETDEEWEVERMKLIATQHKEIGNQYFKNGDYINAVETYTKAIECDSENAVLPANRAMALLKQEKYAAAELDCTRSLTIDESYVKAYHRRGTARAALKKYPEAKEDFLQVLKKEPKNKQAKAELEKVERLINPPKLLQSKNLEASDIGIVKAIYKPPNQRSQKPLCRMIIEEIGEEEKEARRKDRMKAAQEHQSETTKVITDQDNAKFDKLIQQLHDVDTNGDEMYNMRASNLKLTSNNDDDESGTFSASNQNSEISNAKIEIIGGTNDISESEVVDRINESLKLDKVENRQMKKDKGHLSGNLNYDGEKDIRDSSTSSPRVLAIPTSSYQFQADWKVLKGTTEQFYQYFKKIDPLSLPKLLGQFLDADVLNKIFSTLQQYYLPDKLDPYPVLLSLCNVKRFSMTVMFMSAKEKQVLKSVFSYLKEQAQHKKEDIEKLSAKYEV